MKEKATIIRGTAFSGDIAFKAINSVEGIDENMKNGHKTLSGEVTFSGKLQ